MAETITKCLECGGPLQPNPKTGVPTCTYCYREYPDGVESYSYELKEVARLRQAREFIQAEELCRDLKEKQPESSEVYWQLLLASLGVVYVKDEGDRSKPTFFSYSYSDREKISENENFKKALQYAKSAKDREYYEKKGEELDKLLRAFFNLVAKENSYDIFISFKRSTDVTYSDGHTGKVDTDDYKKAEEIYNHLKNKYKVFFSPVSIGKDTGIEGEKYEPRILKALQTAQAMILVGTKKEYLEAQWVENEWRRYMYFIDKKRKASNSLILGYMNNMPGLPTALASIQLPSFDMFKSSYLRELEEKLKFVKSSKGLRSQLGKKTVNEHFDVEEGGFDTGNIERVVISGEGKNLDIKIPANENNDMKMAEDHRTKDRFKQAIIAYDNILKANPHNSKAYWFRFMSNIEAATENDVAVQLTKARVEHFKDIDLAIENSADVDFSWKLVDTIIGGFKQDWKSSQHQLVFNAIEKYITADRAIKVLNAWESQYKLYISRGTVKMAEELFVTTRKLFFKENRDYNIRYMQHYAEALYAANQFDLARVYFEELAGVKKNAEYYLYLLKCRVKTSDIEHTKFKLKVNPDDDSSAKKPSELDLDEIIERIIFCSPSQEVMKVLEGIVGYQIVYNTKNAMPFIETVVSCIRQADNNPYLISFLMMVANRFIQRKDFKHAKVFFTEVLAVDTNYTQAHWGLLKCRFKAFDDYDIVGIRKDLQLIDEFNNARNCASNDEHAAIMKIYNAQQSKNRKAPEYQDRKNYTIYRAITRKKRRAKKAVVTLLILLLLATSGFSYWEYSHPYNYTLSHSDGYATLKSSSLYAKWFIEDFEAERYYDNLQVVVIQDGALKNSRYVTATIPSSVTKIGYSAFRNNHRLETVTFGSQYLDIGNYAFAGCELLTTVNFGTTSSNSRAVTYGSVGEGAFQDCASLTDLYFKDFTSFGANAFSGCESLESITIDTDRDVTFDNNAFDDIPSSTVVYIPTVREAMAKSVSKQFPKLKVETYTREAIEEFVYYLEQIGTVKLSSEEAIVRAETAYNELTNVQKMQITSEQRQMLTDARAVFDVMKLINDIGTVTKSNECDVAICAAENAYSSLTSDQKNGVSNYGELVRARSSINSLYQSDIDRIEKIVDELVEITLQSVTSIEEAEQLYASLPASQKARVAVVSELTDCRRVYGVVKQISEIPVLTSDNYAELLSADEAFKNLSKALQAKVGNRSTIDDAFAAYEVVEKIDEIKNMGEIVATNECDAQIVNCEDSYDSLTEEQKTFVGNYKDLTDAREKINTAYNPIIEEVQNVIEAVGEVGFDSAEAIAAAEESYESLPDSQKKRVDEDYVALLQEVRLVYDLIVDIDNLNKKSKISMSEKNALEKAESVYEGLTDAQKEQIINYFDLVDVRSIFDVVKQINDLIPIYGHQSNDLSQMVDNFNALSDEQQDRVGNADKIADLQIVLAVAQAIADIGDVTHDAEKLPLIDTAEEMYNALTNEQKKLLARVDFLLRARSVYYIMEDLQSLANDSVSITLTSKYSSSTTQTLRVSNMVSVLNDDLSRYGTITFNQLRNLDHATDWRNAFSQVDTFLFDISGGHDVNTFTFNNSAFTYTVKGKGNEDDLRLSVSSELTEFSLNLTDYVISTAGVALDFGSVNVILTFSGTCGLVNYSSGGKTIVSSADLYINLQPNASVTIKGGSGSASANGGTAITAKNLTLNFRSLYGNDYATLTIAGGAGGNGNNAASHSGNGKGPKGGNGGNGGNGAEVSNLYIANTSYIGKLIITGGAGGAGGVGSEGTGSKSDGGDGGNGGIGGHGVKLSSSLNSTMASYAAYVYGGPGGAGGTGGKGANGGWWNDAENGGDGGNGGNGGVGILDSNQKYVGSVGAGGVRGEGGARGTGASGGASKGSNGDPGIAGKNGSEIYTKWA